MEFLLLIVVAGLYYIIYLTAVMYSEKIVVLPIIIYAILFVIIGITYIFIGDRSINKFQCDFVYGEFVLCMDGY